MLKWEQVSVFEAVKKWWKQQVKVCVFVCVGPFWICVTLVFSVAISGNLSTFLSRLGDPSYHYRPQFHRGQSSSFPLIAQSWFCRWSRTVTVCISSLFGLSDSDNSCTSHLPVRLAGADRFMGFPDLAERGWKATWRLLLLGNGVRLRLLPLHLHPHLGKSDVLSRGWQRQPVSTEACVLQCQLTDRHGTFVGSSFSKASLQNKHILKISFTFVKLWCAFFFFLTVFSHLVN